MEDLKCRDIFTAADKCAHAKSFCNDSSLIPYTTAYFCTFPGVPFLSFLFLCIWLCFLFAVMAKAASEYVSPNLQSIVKILGIGQVLAGVTLFAFGNGSSDLFSTFAAVSSGNVSLAIGELFGAATFISAVVAGSMAIITPFTVPKATFARDVGFFLGAEALTFAIVVDGTITLTESYLLIGYYCFYVGFVIIWHWYADRLAARNLELADDQSNCTTDDNPHGAVVLADQQDDFNSLSINPVADETTSLLKKTPILTTQELPISANRQDLSSNKISDTNSTIETTSQTGYIALLMPTLHQSIGTGWRGLLMGVLLTPSDLILALTAPRVEPTEVPAASGSSCHPSTAELASSPRLAIDDNQKADPAKSLERTWPRWLLIVQAFTSPLFFGFNLMTTIGDGISSRSLIILLLSSAIVSVVCLVGIYFLTSKHQVPRYYSLLSFAGFFVAIAWVSLAANEIVGILEVLGPLLGISDAVLGFTVFAVGNSLNDFFANLAVARAGMPLMSLGACFGGPMFNTLLGIGLGVAWDIGLHKGGCTTTKSGACLLNVPISLVVSGCTLLTLLAGLLIVLPFNNWRMDRKVGWTMVSIWILSVVCNLILQLTVPDNALALSLKHFATRG